MSHFKDRIEEAQKQLDSLKTDVAEMMGMAEAEERDLSDDESLQLEAYAADIEKAEKRIRDLEMAEKAMAQRVIEKQAPALVRHQPVKDRPKAELFFRMAAVHAIAHTNKENPLQVAKQAFPSDHGLEAVLKTAIDPATTTAAGWAAELMDDTRQGYLDLLRGVSVAAQLWPAAGMNLIFDGFTGIKVPSRAGTTTDLASGWTGEGAAIPVRRATFASQNILPYKWAAITTMTKEAMNRSMPSLMAILQQGIIEDTATKLDNDFLGTAAAVAGFSPAGVYNGVTGTAAATGGATVGDDMLLDLRNLLDPIYAANMGQAVFICVHPSNALSMSTVLYNGTYLFRDELSQGRLLGRRVIESTNVPIDELWALDMAQIAVASSAPTVSVSDSATLVMVDDDGVGPEMGASQPRVPSGQVGDAARDNVNNPPIRSLYQTETVAIKSVQYLSWAKLRAGCVNRITGVSY